MDWRGVLTWVTQDRAVNSEGKSRCILSAFRFAQLCRTGRTPLPRVLERALDRGYRSATGWLGLELHPDVQAGQRLRIYHCHGIVLNPRARLGADCVLRSGVCLGNKMSAAGEESPAPDLGDGVDVGVAALVIGPVRIGSGARIGAGAVVLHDVDPGATVVGNPARRVGLSV